MLPSQSNPILEENCVHAWFTSKLDLDINTGGGNFQKSHESKSRTFFAQNWIYSVHIE